MYKSKARTSYLKSLSALLIASSILAPVASQAGDEYSPGYQYDMRGYVVRDAKGNCVRTSKWSPTDAIAACDSTLTKERAGEMPVREKKARVTGVTTQIDLAILHAGDDFAFDSAELSNAGKQVLDATLKSHSDDYIHRVHIAGYTDQIGNDEYNLKLSQRRGDSVKKELIAQGLPEERIRVTAHGSADPIVTCPGLAGAARIRCLAPNRRVEVRFVIPVVNTDAAAEFVARRRQDEVKDKNIQVEAVAVDTPIIQQGFKDATKIIGDGCSKEVATFCDDVPIGENRVLNCLHEHNAHLSAGCQASIDKGNSTIEAALGNANFFGAKCGPDLERLCSGVKPVGGALLACLMDNINNTEKRCYDAMIETGLLTH